MAKVLELTYLPPSRDAHGNPRSLMLQIFRRCLGVVFAILLASIFAPLCDHFVIERNIKRRKARTEKRP